MAANARNNRDGIELRKCYACGFVFSEKAEFAYEELFANWFADKTKEDLVRRAQHEGLDKLVGELVSTTKIAKGARVLDFGSGIGLTCLMLQELGLEVIAVEESKKYVEKHATLGIKSLQSLAELARYRGSFDLVVVKDVLEHLSNPREIVAELAACVRPGGYFYVRVPNVLAYPFHWSISTKEHVNHFTPKTLTRLLEENGMEKLNFIGVHDVSSRVGRIYHSVFWSLRSILPLYHQISLLFRRK